MEKVGRALTSSGFRLLLLLLLLLLVAVVVVVLPEERVIEVEGFGQAWEVRRPPARVKERR